MIIKTSLHVLLKRRSRVQTDRETNTCTPTTHCRRGSLLIWVTWRNQTDSPLAEKDDLFTRWQLVGTATDCVLGDLPDGARGERIASRHGRHSVSILSRSLALAMMSKQEVLSCYYCCAVWWTRRAWPLFWDRSS